MNIELQKLFLDSPFEPTDFSEKELEQITKTKKITKPKKINKIKLVIKSQTINNKK